MVPPIKSTMFLVMDMPRPVPLNAADSGAFLSAERLKDVFLELFAHANAIVLDAELIAATALGRTVLLSNADADHAACGSELDGVGQNVQQRSGSAAAGR